MATVSIHSKKDGPDLVSGMSATYGVRRQSGAATALWLKRIWEASGVESISAVSQSGVGAALCHRIPKQTGEANRLCFGNVKVRARSREAFFLECGGLSPL